MPVLYGEGTEHAFRRLRNEIPSYAAAPQFADASTTTKTESCLANLAAINQTRFLSQTLTRSKNSCTWVSKVRKFTSWRENSESSLFCITARAGCGKTTLAANISQMIRTECPHEPQASKETTIENVVLHLFFRRSNQGTENIALAALRTITSQLVLQVAEVLVILTKRHDDLSVKGGFEWSWETLSSVFSDMLEQTLLYSRVYIIFDAVDECESQSRMLILDWIKELVEIYSTNPTGILKILVTSRPDGGVPDELSGFPILAIRDSDTANDIRELIHSRIEDFASRRHLTLDVTQYITQFLELNAQGMFLWVVLVMEKLERRDERLKDEVIASKLSRIPLTLIDTYGAILNSVLPTRQKDMWRILRWLLFGSRNLCLAELEVGLCLETGDSKWHGFAGDLNFLCGSFIRFDGPREEIGFVHQTARAFLEAFIQNLDASNVAGLSMNVNEVNESLAKICVQYMLKEEEFEKIYECTKTRRSRSTFRDMLEDLLRRYPFLRYAIESWATHIRATGRPSSALSSMTHTLLSSLGHRFAIMALTFFIIKNVSWGVPVPTTPLHVAAYFNLPWILDSYISQEGIPVDSIALMGDTPLIWASEMGSTECVKKLLEAGANPNIFERDGWSALH